MSGDLLRWLSECLDAFEEVARASVDPWERVAGWDGPAEHVEMHSPRAVLARVEAERGLVAAYETPDLDPNVMADVLRIVAYGHRFDHPGYDPAWAPDD